MPKISYSEEERAKIRSSLLATALELMSKQGVRHTTVEQVYKKVGISRTFFYTFFSTKDELVLEALYFQHPHILALAQKLASDPALSWREAVTEFLALCCRDGKHGILVLAIEDQQFIFCRLSKDSYQMFRQKQLRLFGSILECFGIKASPRAVNVFINLSLAAIIMRRAIPDTLPLFVPEAADETVDFQLNAIVDALEKLKTDPTP